MKLNNRGFAITSIIYSMLILFLTLVVLIIGNLASRKVVFDKQKEDILNKINTLPKLCALANDSEKEKYKIGAKYECNLGDNKTRIFYVLENNQDSDDISLIMDRNYDDTAISWCDQEEDNRESKECNADGLISKLQEIRNNWTELQKEQIGLPSANQIAKASGNNAWNDESGNIDVANWLWGNLYTELNPNLLKVYFTSTSQKSYTNRVWIVSYQGKLAGTTVNKNIGSVRPVITIYKDQLD